MMNMEFNEKLNELAEDRLFVESVCSAATAEEVKELFKAKHIEVDDEAAEAFLAKVRGAVNAEAGEELGENDLDDVNGGVLGLCAAATIGGWAIAGAVAGVALGVCLVKLYSFVKYGK